MTLVLNIFFSGSSEGEAYFHRKELGIDGEKMVSVTLALHAGDISKPMSVNSRRKVYNAWFDCMSDNISAEIRRLKKCLNKENNVCIWYSVKDTDEYLGMLAMLEYLNGKGKNIFLCEYSDLVNVLAYLEDVTIQKPPEKKHLDGLKYQLLIDEWYGIKEINSELRIIRNGRIENLPADYMDKRIFEIMGDNEIKIANITQELLSSDFPRLLYFINYRIRQLIDLGEINLVKQGMVDEGIYGTMRDFLRSTVIRNRTCG